MRSHAWRGIAAIVLATTALHAEESTVLEVEYQPLSAQSLRVAEALDFLGSPLEIGRAHV